MYQWRSQDFADGGAKEVNARVSAREILGCHAHFRSRDAGTPTFLLFRGCAQLAS